jgi:cell division protein FtsX
MNVEKTNLFKLATKDSKEKEIANIVKDIKKAKAKYEIAILNEQDVVDDLQDELNDAMGTLPLNFNIMVEIQKSLDLAKDKMKRMKSLSKDLFMEV